MRNALSIIGKQLQYNTGTLTLLLLLPLFMNLDRPWCTFTLGSCTTTTAATTATTLLLMLMLLMLLYDEASSRTKGSQSHMPVWLLRVPRNAEVVFLCLGFCFFSSSHPRRRSGARFYCGRSPKKQNRSVSWAYVVMLVLEWIWYDVIRYIYTTHHETSWYDIIKYDIIRYDIIRYDIKRYDIIGYGIIQYECGIRYDTMQYHSDTVFTSLLNFYVTCITCTGRRRPCAR